MFGRRASNAKKDDAEKSAAGGIRSRSKQSEPENRPYPGERSGSETGSGSSSAPGIGESRLGQQRKNNLDAVLARVEEFGDSLQDRLHTPSRGEDDLYEKADKRRIPPRKTGAAVPDESSSEWPMMADERRRDYEEKAERLSTFQRIDRLSPLARGVLWSTILDSPVGMKDPENSPR